MTDLDQAEFLKGVSGIIRDAVSRAAEAMAAENQALLKRIESLEARQPEKGDPGPRGEDGEPVLVADVVAELLETDSLTPLVDLYTAQAVAKHFEAHPVRHGKDGSEGPQGLPGKDGAKGEDGAGIADLLIDRDGSLVATMTDGRVKSLGQVVGRDGQDGKDGLNGKDGAGLVDLVRSYDAEAHEIVERWGEKELRYPAGGIRPGGYWREGTKAVAAQVWNHAGVAWIAKRDTSEKPCRESKDWEIFANKGRDGLNGKDGKPPPGPIKLGGNDG
jgi:hypothetical protein